MPVCKDCKLFDLDAVKSKSGAVLSNRVAACLWKSTETWPVSVMERQNSRPHAGYMKPNEPHRCQRFIPRGAA
jgi:hypothetical protein